MRSSRRQSSHAHHNSGLIRLLTFATAVIVSQFYVPLTTAMMVSTASATRTPAAIDSSAAGTMEEAERQTTAAMQRDEAFNGTIEGASIEVRASTVPSMEESAGGSQPTSISSIGMTSKATSSLVLQSSTAAYSAEIAYVSRVGGKSRITSRNSDEWAEGGSTASATLAVDAATSGRGSTSTSQFPLDFAFTKNHWSHADAVSFGVSAPASSSSTSSSSSSSSSSATSALSSASLASLSSSSSSSHLSTSNGGSTSAGREAPRTFRISKHHHEHHWGPFFEGPLNSTAPGDNVITTAHLYTEAVLNCRVGMLKDKTVMWVRRTTEKVSLLTVGNVTYSGDPRIHVRFQYPNNWRLLINPVHWDDAGVYMCQVSTHPPRVFTTNLTILEPPLRLIDEQEREVGDRYYKAGSTIDLQCQVSRSFIIKEKAQILKSIQPLLSLNRTKTSDEKMAANAATSALLGANSNALELIGVNQTDKQLQSVEKQFGGFIFWRKDDGMSLPAAAVKRSSTSEQWLTVRVSIPDARLADSGNYSCSIGRLFTAIVQVQVLTGELPAAVQHSGAAAVMTTARRRRRRGPLLPMHVAGLSDWMATIMISLLVAVVARIHQTYRLLMPACRWIA